MNITYVCHRVVHGVGGMVATFCALWIVMQAVGTGTPHGPSTLNPHSSGAHASKTPCAHGHAAAGLMSCWRCRLGTDIYSGFVNAKR